MTPEGNLVAYLCKRAKAEGFRVRKLSYEGRHGAPDRLILAPGAAVFVEVKAPGQRPRPEQTRELAIFNDSGFTPAGWRPRRTLTACSRSSRFAPGTRWRKTPMCDALFGMFVTLLPLLAAGLVAWILSWCEDKGKS